MKNIEIFECKQSLFTDVIEQIYPSLNPVYSLRNPGRIFQDPESQGSCQVLFRILFRILIIPVSRIFQGETRFYSGFLQVPAQIYFSELRIQDPIRIYSRLYQGSCQDYEREFCQDFIRFSSGSRWNLRVRILSGVIATSDKDLGKKITRSVRIRNWLILQSFNQDLVQNFSRICASKPSKTMSILIRTLIRKCKDLSKIFTGFCLVYSAMSISWDSLEGSFRIINLKDPVRFDSGFDPGFVQVLARIFFWIEFGGSC